MAKVKLIQKQLSALRDTVVDKTVIGEFDSREKALDFLAKRGYRYDAVYDSWIHGNAVQFPVTIQETRYSPFDIRSFG
jgi:hypothetical protein